MIRSGAINPEPGEKEKTSSDKRIYLEFLLQPATEGDVPISSDDYVVVVSDEIAQLFLKGSLSDRLAINRYFCGHIRFDVNQSCATREREKGEDCQTDDFPCYTFGFHVGRL